MGTSTRRGPERASVSDEGGSEESEDFGSVAEMLENEDFQYFLSQFEDSESLGIGEKNRAEIAKRREVFLDMTEVKQTMREVIGSEGYIEKLGYKPSEADFAAVDAAIEKRIFEKKDYAFLKTLMKSATAYNELPKEMELKRTEFADFASRKDLAKDRAHLKTEIRGQQKDLKKAKEDHRGIGLAKEGVLAVRNLEKVSAPAESAIMKEAETVVSELRGTFNSLEAVGKKLLAINEKSPKPGRITLPDISGLKTRLLDLSKNDPEEYLKTLAGSNISSRLEAFKAEQEAACQAQINLLTGLSSRKKNETKYPTLAASLSEFKVLFKEISQINVNPEAEEQLGNLSADFGLVASIKKDLKSLEANPSDAAISLSIKETAAELQTNAGKKLALDLASPLGQLEGAQQKLENSKVNPKDTAAVFEYSNKGWIGKIFARIKHPFASQNPESRAAKQLAREERSRKDLQMQDREIVDAIKSIDDAERQLAKMGRDFEKAKDNLFLSMDEVKVIFQKARFQAEAALAENLGSEDLSKVFAGVEMADKLFEARQKQSKLFGKIGSDDTESIVYREKALDATNLADAYDPNDELDDELARPMPLKTLRSNMEGVVTKKVMQAALKALEKWKPQKEKEISSKTLAAQLELFENSLGPLADSEQYQKVKFLALEALLAEGSGLSKSKKFALKVMLSKQEKSGSFNFNFGAFAPQAA